MSNIGYHRYRFKPTEEEQEILVYSRGDVFAKAIVKARNCCEGGKYLKYLDEFGRYRYFGFNDKWTSRINSIEIGTFNNTLLSLLYSHADKKTVGSKVNKVLSLSAASLSVDERLKLSQVLYSPRVYLYVGSGDVRNQDFILVKATGDNVDRNKDKSFSDVNITIQLPKHYAITSIQ